MKLVVALLAVSVFASLICPASFKRWKEMDGKCPAAKKCMTRDPDPHRIPEGDKNCTCVEWGCIIDKVYYTGVGCEGEDMVCKYGASDDLSGGEQEKLRGGDCDPLLPKPPTTTTTTTPEPKNKDAITTTTSGTDESKYGAWKLAGMALIGCFVFFFGGQLW